MWVGQIIQGIAFGTPLK